MEIIYQERYPWNTGQTFEIRIIKEPTNIIVAINWIPTTNGEEESINLKHFDYPSETKLEDMIERAKAFISTVRTIDEDGNVNK